jgi:hypothetical protein
MIISKQIRHHIFYSYICPTMYFFVRCLLQALRLNCKSKKKTEDFTISQPLASEEKKTREEGFEMISEQIRHHIFHSFCCMLQQDMLSSPQHHPMWLELCPTTRRGSASPGQFCSTKSVGLAHRQGLCCPGYTCITCMSRLWLYVWLRPESLAWPSSFHLRAVRAFSQP